MIISLPVTQTNAQNQPSTIHPEPDKRTPLLRGASHWYLRHGELRRATARASPSVKIRYQ